MSRLRRRFQRRAADGTATPAGLLRGARFRRGPVPGPPSERARRERLAILIAMISIGFLGMAARCAHLQIVRAPDLLALARSQHEKAVDLDPRRGPILDRNGQELALSIDVDSLYADPSKVADAAAAARRLAPVLGMKASEIRERLDGGKHFAWVRRKVDPALRARVESLGIEGIAFVRESRRFYPKRDLAAHVVGACGVDNQGLAGLEFAFNERFTGTPGRLEFLRDGRGGRVLDRSRVEPVPGDGMILTLDAAIQHIAERELDVAMRETRADGAAIVVLRPETGEILALASRPGFDANEFPEASVTARRNRAVSDFFEPGSTFKVITAAAALDAGRVRPGEVIWCENGSYVVAKHRFKEDRLPFGNLTFTEVLARSSNVGTIKVAQRLPSTDFIEVIRRFGFGRSTSLELPGESPGLLRDLKRWSGLSHASISMGQEIGVTPIQLAAALGALANDGMYNPPHLIEAFVAADGSRTEPERDGDFEARRAVSAKTARTLRDMLQSVTIDGTGQAAQVVGYTTGGKTGTAQKIDPATRRYARGKYAAWFGGFVPAERPALVLVVMVDEPKGIHQHGGDVSAPVFSRVAEPVLRYLGVLPDREDPLVIDAPLVAAARPAAPAVQPASLRTSSRKEGSAVPASRTAPAGAAPSDARSFGRKILDAATRTIPVAGGTVQAGFIGSPAGADEGREVVMPDLTGMSLKQATEALGRVGLNCSSRLTGPRVSRQEPVAGLAIRPGARCSIILE
ncbi:MAG TPA: penicillin-binding transpeptidase domain-containing protein [Candidatus Polarisedimenticolia bacterium]|nr:penicillin-binding transpeptidase domain-containing protein [Candidatus Polarisedimenticolia bacterium]